MTGKNRERQFPYDLGVIHGRFQVLHNDHLKYLHAGKVLCEHLIVGITNPDPVLSREDKTDPKRSAPGANPLTYYERYVLVKETLMDMGLTMHEFTIVPLPINLPDLYQCYVPMDAVFFISIYDDWGRRKLENFQNLGLKTHVLWEVSKDEKGISAADIRDAMVQDRPWEHLVPACVAEIMKRWDIPGRLKKMQGGCNGA
jgi:nicotinamide mononucleotide adenylyltransferase